MGAGETTDPPQLVALDSGPILIGRSGEAGLRLYDQTVSREHAILTRSDGELIIEDHESRFGTFVNGTPVRRVVLRPGDRVRFGSSVTYRLLDTGTLQLDEAPHGIDLAGSSSDGDARRCPRPS